MAKFLVTVKLPKNPDHDPRNKKVGQCPVNTDILCTDITGEHHTVLWEGDSLYQAMFYWKSDRGLHVTRVEEIV